MPDFVLNCAGTTRTTGTAGYLITGTTGKSRSMLTTLTNGQVVAYHIEYKSSKAGFEDGVGTWNTSTSTLARTSVTASSNANAAVSWGAGDKIISCTANVEMLKSIPAKPQKAAGEPILVVITGQSNACGTFPTATIDAMPINTQVKVWQPVNGSQSTGACSFVVADPIRAGFTWATGDILIGLPGRYTTAGPTLNHPIGNMGWSCSNLLQEQTQGLVYLVCIAEGGEFISDWASGAEVEARMALEIPLAIAAIAAETGYTLAAPDVVIWHQGESDVLTGMTGITYANTLATFKTLAETKWSVKGFTQWAVGELVQTFNLYNPIAREWSGHRRFVDEQGSDTHLISSKGVAVATDNVHFTGDGTNEMGIRVAKAYLAGMTPKVHGLVPAQNLSLVDMAYGPTLQAWQQFTDLVETPFTYNNSTTATMYGNSCTEIVLSGTNSKAEQTGYTIDGRLGVASLWTGSDTTGRAGVTFPHWLVGFVPGASNFTGRIVMRCDFASGTGSQNYTAYAGFLSVVGNTPTFGLFFKHDESSIYWKCVSKNAGGEEVTVTTAQAAAAAFVTLRIDYYAGSTALFYIDSVFVAAHTRLPDFFSVLRFGATIVKSSGATTRRIAVDAMHVNTPGTTQYHL